MRLKRLPSTGMEAKKRAPVPPHSERDLLIPWQSNKAVADAAEGQFVLLPKIGHYEVYAGQPLVDVLDHIAGFLTERGLA